MIKIVVGTDRAQQPKIFRQMFEGRAEVFHRRLGWEVKVVDGQEYDHYDQRDDTVYIVSVDENGNVQGSLRLLPTTGETMLRNEFADFFDEPVDVMSPTIWECTRFCAHPSVDDAKSTATRQVSSELLIALCDLCLQSGIEHVMGLIFGSSTRVYQRIGWKPEPIAESVTHRGHLQVCLWEVSAEALSTMRRVADRSRSDVSMRIAA